MCRRTQRTIFRSVSNLTYFVVKRIHLQFKVVKYYSFKLKLYSLFASQERPKIIASKMLPARIDTLECFTPLWKSTKTTIFPYFSPNLTNKWLISCNYCIIWTLWLEIKQKENFHIYSILWKCQQVRFPRRIDISPNKSLGTPDVSINIIKKKDLEE